MPDSTLQAQPTSGTALRVRGGTVVSPSASTERMQITDEVVTKDFPPSIEALPHRAGQRPRIARQYPCLQLTDTGDGLAQAAIVGHVRAWPGVTVTAVRQNIPDCQALVPDGDLALGQGEAFILGDKFAHVRRVGSVHAALAPKWGEEILRRGWAQIHPLALYGLIPAQSLNPSSSAVARTASAGAVAWAVMNSRMTMRPQLAHPGGAARLCRPGVPPTTACA